MASCRKCLESLDEYGEANPKDEETVASVSTLAQLGSLPLELIWACSGGCVLYL